VTSLHKEALTHLQQQCSNHFDALDDLNEPEMQRNELNIDLPSPPFFLAADFLHAGLTLKWDCKNRTCDISVPRHTERALEHFKHPEPKRPFVEGRDKVINIGPVGAADAQVANNQTENQVLCFVLPWARGTACWCKATLGEERLQLVLSGELVSLGKAARS
jgi:hypothetical protein